MTPGAGPVLVIGYGNPLRSDDGVGPVVAERLAADPRFASVEVRSEHQLAPELAPDVSRASLLVLVDADVEQEPGRVAVRRLEAGPAGDAWTHHLDARGLLALASDLYGAAPTAWLVSVGPSSLELGEGLTPGVAGAVDAVVEIVADLVAGRAPGT